MAYLDMVCSVSLKKFEENGRVENKKCPKKLSTADEHYLKVMSLRNEKIQQTSDTDPKHFLTLQLVHLLFTEVSSEMVSVE